jgi:HlyD family secretion protein
MLMAIRDTAAQDRVLAAPAWWQRHRGQLLLGSALGLGLLLAVPLVARMLQAESAVSASRLRFDTVHRGPLVRDVQVPGRVVAAVSPSLYAPAAGSITLRVNAGAQVKQGEVLALIESPELQSLLHQANSLLQTLDVDVRRQRIDNRKQALGTRRLIDLAQVAFAAAQREMARAEKSWAIRAISEVDYQRAKDELSQAELTFQHANGDAALERESLAFEQEARELALEQQRLRAVEVARLVAGLEVRAPVDGLVGSIAVTDRTAVAQNQVLMTVVDLARLEIDVQIPETMADDLGLGMLAEIRIGAERHPGSVVSIAPEITQNQVSGRVRFAGVQPTSVRQNQRVEVRIVIEEKSDVLQLTRGPFVDTGGGRIAYVVADGIAQRRSIEVGATSIAAVEVLSGLVEGDRVVISSIDEFRGAQRVAIAN